VYHHAASKVKGARRKKPPAFARGLVALSCYEDKSALSRDLQFHHVRCLRTTVALCDFELNRLAFFQGFEAVALDCREVNEYIVAVLYGDKTVAFFCVKPLNCTFQMKNLLKARRQSTNEIIITEIPLFCNISGLSHYAILTSRSKDLGTGMKGKPVVKYSTSATSRS
jgi:hypothetical protein